MSISERQLGLIQDGAKILKEKLGMLLDEAAGVITLALKEELGKRNISMEALDARPRPERTAFIRSVVQRIEVSLQKKHTWNEKKIQSSIEEFYKILHESWDHE